MAAVSEVLFVRSCDMSFCVNRTVLPIHSLLVLYSFLVKSEVINTTYWCLSFSFYYYFCLWSLQEAVIEVTESSGSGFAFIYINFCWYFRQKFSKRFASDARLVKVCRNSASLCGIFATLPPLPPSPPSWVSSAHRTACAWPHHSRGEEWGAVAV